MRGEEKNNLRAIQIFGLKQFRIDKDTSENLKSLNKIAHEIENVTGIAEKGKLRGIYLLAQSKDE